MWRIVRTDSTNMDFIELVKALDADLAIRDGAEHAFYNQFNKIDSLQHVVVLYNQQEAFACGAIKKYDDSSVEVKRMYTTPPARGKGCAATVLTELEKWAVELSYTRSVLETGRKQPEAIGLYLKQGYKIIPNYGQYALMENSVCFEKTIG